MELPPLKQVVMLLVSDGRRYFMYGLKGTVDISDNAIH